MKKILILLIACLVLVGCGGSADPTPTQDADKPPVTTTTPPVEEDVPTTKEGYVIVNRGNDEGMVDGVFKHNHELDFDSFVGDYFKANSTSPGKACSYLEQNPNAVKDYIESNGEVPSSKKNVTWDPESSLEYQAQMIVKLEDTCPDTVASFRQ